MTSRSSATMKRSDAINDRNLPGKELYFPVGLLGFPMCRRYRVERFALGDGGESPFLMLNALDQEIAFPLIHPDSISLDYRFPVKVEVLTALGAKSQEELVPLLIVTVRDRLEEITLNLQGPLIVNPTSSVGFQLVIEEYPLRYPLFKTA